MSKRVKEWGSTGFDQRVDAAWDVFSSSAESWMTIVEQRGPDAVEAAFVAVLGGSVSPNEAYIISFDG